MPLSYSLTVFYREKQLLWKKWVLYENILKIFFSRSNYTINFFSTFPMQGFFNMNDFYVKNFDGKMLHTSDE